MIWTEEKLIAAALTRPLTAERLEKVRKRCQSPEQWARVQKALEGWTAGLKPAGALTLPMTHVVNPDPAA
jgi:hypothetical protein